MLLLEKAPKPPSSWLAANTLPKEEGACVCAAANAPNLSPEGVSKTEPPPEKLLLGGGAGLSKTPPDTVGRSCDVAGFGLLSRMS